MRKKNKVPKRKRIKRLFTKAWAEFSKYIRRKEKNICFTCGATGVTMHAGHYKHTGKYKLHPLNFNEVNIHCQCVRCNTYGAGRLDLYSMKLEQRFGYGVLQGLQQKFNSPDRLTEVELAELYYHYKRVNNAEYKSH